MKHFMSDMRFSWLTVFVIIKQDQLTCCVVTQKPGHWFYYSSSASPVLNCVKRASVFNIQEWKEHSEAKNQHEDAGVFMLYLHFLKCSFNTRKRGCYLNSFHGFYAYWHRRQQKKTLSPAGPCRHTACNFPSKRSATARRAVLQDAGLCRFSHATVAPPQAASALRENLQSACSQSPVSVSYLKITGRAFR